MDVREYITLLCIQSNHLCNLSVQLATQMEQVEQALTAQGITTYADTRELLDGVVDLSMVTANIADSFHKRMQALREKSKRAGEGSEEPTANENEQKSSALSHGDCGRVEDKRL